MDYSLRSINHWEPMGPFTYSTGHWEHTEEEVWPHIENYRECVQKLLGLPNFVDEIQGR
jgi:hypothetical protein